MRPPTLKTDAVPALSRIDVDLGALSHNVSVYLQASAGSNAVVAATVKKDAYGLGAAAIAPTLDRAGCGMLCVYAPDEAVALGNAGITLPLLVLMPVRALDRTDRLYPAVAARRLHLTLHGLAQIDALQDAARRLATPLPVHLHLDTGMTREGVPEPDWPAAFAAVAAASHLRLAGVMTHFATADDDPRLMERQLDRFDAALVAHAAQIPDDALIHAGNSYAPLRPGPHARDMIRPGLGLFGYAAERLRGGDARGDLPPLRPVVAWRSRLMGARVAPAGATIGYGATHTLARPSLLGTVPVGYGDGYPLALSNRGVMRVDLPHPDDPSLRLRTDAAVLGRVNMDQTVVDLTDAAEALGFDLDAEAPPEPSALERLNDSPVEVYSADPGAPNALHRVAELAGSHPYELLCRLHPRVVRRCV